MEGLIHRGAHFRNFTASTMIAKLLVNYNRATCTSNITVAICFLLLHVVSIKTVSGNK